ncbi:5-oxoprolinase subunit PxpB [uncultured Microbulbifer sp.]|uniref:5-oxoprolinase subunit PxpB n=1 Tax=uncultured Microbulbifer sp. TaxID=348147 RepID=UPI002631D6A6|nr:5-oxoprolinase subunit PxpB [uncultured Microbulbifer sp.]
MLRERRFELSPNGDAALDIRFSAAPGEQLSEAIIALSEAIEAESFPAVTELVPAYQCLTVCFDPLQLSHSGSGSADLPKLESSLATLTQKILAQTLRTNKKNTDEENTDNEPPEYKRTLIRIPVCYDEQFAPDIQTLCSHTGLTAAEIIARHTAPRYLVHMLGFTPGFLYLGGLDEQLHCPRKARPELKIAAGSVGIGGGQTGIYPQATPGGWQIIGRTPLALFRPDQDPPFIAHPLDRIQFVAISPEQFTQTDPFSAPDTIPLTEFAAPEVRR